MKINIGCLINDRKKVSRILLKSEFPKERLLWFDFGNDSASKGFNRILECGLEDVLLVCHQDMYFPAGWFDKLEGELQKLPANWVVTGFFGINERGEWCGKIHDRRVPLPLDTGHKLPCNALSVDGCAMVINLKYGLTFDENMEGFDLYDTYATLRARELGTAWIIDNPPEHYPTRPWEWQPDPIFMKNWEYLKKRFPSERIISTCYRD